MGVPAEVWFSPALLGLLGLMVGSFLNVLILRWPHMLERQWWGDVAAQLADAASWRQVFARSGEPPAAHVATAEALTAGLSALPAFSLSRPRSRCPKCGHVLKWHENIPVLGWLRLAGRCAACRTPISPRYPFVEALTAGLFAAIGWRFGAQPVTLLWCGFGAALVALTFIDWDTTLLPDGLTLPLLWAGLAASAFGLTLSPTDAIWGAVAGYLSLWSVYWAFKLATGKEGMGHGDFKLLAALGAWLGAAMIVPILLAASVLGAVIGLVIKARGGLREGRYVPFGPFLAGAGAVVMLAGPTRVLGWLGWA